MTDICRQVGFLPQDPNALLFADQVQNELEITLRHLNLPIDQDRITQTLMQLDLQGCATVYPRDLCSGERQRVALATLMVTRHACLLLDEPTRGLDPHMKNDLGPLLQRLASQGAGILLVTHDVELVARVADRIVVIKSGRIIAQGKPYPVLRDHSEFSP